MPLYLTQASYTSDSWKVQIAKPQNRAAQIKKMAESAGCKVHNVYYSFGEFDIVAIIEAPDNVTASSFLIAVAGGGAASRLQTTVLLTAEEGLQAIKKAKGVGYTPPGR